MGFIHFLFYKIIVLLFIVGSSMILKNFTRDMNIQLEIGKIVLIEANIFRIVKKQYLKVAIENFVSTR